MRQRLIAAAFVSLLLSGRASGPAVRHDYGARVTDEAVLIAAEEKVPAEGRKVLEKGREMAITKGEIYPGTCWDYINAVYTRSGFPESKRHTVFKSKKAGPYADLKLVQGGDWLYFVNHSYGDIEHSSVFVDWVDYGAKEALMLSYAGEKRKEPGRYKTYDLSSVYRIIRPGKSSK
jgi:hypothetical protein